MDSETIEVRAISRVSAALLALIGGTLLSGVRIPAMPEPGITDAASVRVIRMKDANEEMRAVAEALALASALEMRASSLRESAGLGAAVLLWVNGPGGEIVFRNRDRFRRCVQARSYRREEPDCPSAGDPRQMVWEDAGGHRKAARALRGA